MLEIFRNNHFINTLLLILYTLLLGAIPLFFSDNIIISTEGVWTRWIFGETILVNFWNRFAAIFLIFLQGAMLNRLIIKNRVNNEITLFPGLFYILIISFFPGTHLLSTALVANTFALIGIGELFSAHKKQRTAELVFSSGFWFSCAALTHHGYLLLMLYPLLGLSTLRTVKWKNIAQYFVGIITPFFIVSMIAFLKTGLFAQIFAPLWARMGAYRFWFENQWIYLIQIAFFAIWILASLLQYNAFTIKKNIHAQKKVDLFFWLMIFTLLATFFSKTQGQNFWVILAIPLASMMAMTFLRIKTKIVAELLHFLLLIGLLTIQILYYF